MVCFSCYFFGMCGQVHPFRKEIQHIQWHTAFWLERPGGQKPPRILYAEHEMYATPALLGALVCVALLRCRGAETGIFKGSPAIFFGEAFHLHNPKRKEGPNRFLELKLCKNISNPTPPQSPRTDLWMLRECFWVPGLSSSWEWLPWTMTFVYLPFHQMLPPKQRSPLNQIWSRHKAY